MSPEQEPSVLNSRESEDHGVSQFTSASSSHATKPLMSFDTEDRESEDEGLDMEDGLVRRRRRKRKRKEKGYWWDFMGIWQVNAGDEEEDISHLNRELRRGLLGLADPRPGRPRKARRKRYWYSYCYFAGISALTILFVLPGRPFRRLR